MTSQEISLVQCPELADHGFHGLPILPGTWYLDRAVRLTTESLSRRCVLSDVTFHRALVLSEASTEILIERSADAAGEALAFRDGSLGAEPLATMRSERTAGPAVTERPERPAAAGDGVSGSRMYEELARNGNFYGPHFQVIERVWAGPTQAVARLRPRGPLALWDAAAQLAAFLECPRKQTFVLQGIGQVEIAPDGGTPAWAVAEIDGNQARVELQDEAGAVVARFHGLHWTFLARPAAPGRLPLVVSANFTAEPIAEPIRYWAEKLPLGCEVAFAPYDQVFQELLDPRSQTRSNSAGVNVMLLNLADWTPARRTDALVRAASFRWPEGVERHVLPNGTEVAHLNRHETEYVYDEIFRDRCYLRHGVRLPAGATVVDIGANVGLFTLFVRSEQPSARVFAYEPSPAAYAALAANCAAYGPGLTACNAGVAESRGEGELTFYERSSVFSTFHADAAEDRAAISAVVGNMVRGELGSASDAAGVAEYVDDLMDGRMKARTCRCPLVSVSDLIRDHGIERIELLKIDAEKCEREILRGIADEDWSRIEQVVIEVHDRTREAVREVQAILEARGFRCACDEERLLAGSGLFNVYAIRDPHELARERSAPAAEGGTQLEERIAEFSRALDAYQSTAAAPLIVCLCPHPADGIGPELRRQLQAAESRLEDELRARRGVITVAADSLRRRHPGASWHHTASDVVGHVPFTPEGYALLGAAVVRAVAANRRPPFKVIALDCDNTLWAGACGEDGPLGVVIGPRHRAVQEFMLARLGEGMMLCLCSRNSEADVWAVFERHPEMVLKRKHLAAAAIDWQPKSANLGRLAQTLNVSEDAIIFLDDNPVEIAEVRAGAPRVLTIALPVADDRALPRLENCWAFDAGAITAEDRARTRMMQEGAERERFRASAPTLEEFISGLQLEVTMTKPAAEDWARLAQLTLRTNQFNFTTRRRSEFELRQMHEAGWDLFAVSVRDRFGDYGLVGLVQSRVAGSVCLVDTFLLSCRVLGRGVEHRVVSELAQRALDRGAASLEFAFVATPKNRPAADFLHALESGSGRAEGDEMRYRFAADALRSLRYRAPVAAEIPATPAFVAPLPGSALRQAPWEAIADELTDLAGVAARIEAWNGRGQPPAAPAPLPEGNTGRLLALWRRVLGRPALGPDENFLDAGGTSLKAVQLVAAIRRELAWPATVTMFFEAPTARRLAARLAEPRAADAGGRPSAAAALARGARRTARARRTAA